MEKKVSIIMNCKNGQTFLRNSISSVIRQTYKNWELIFFDNFSKDKSIEIAKTFNDKRIKILKAKKSLKLYDARNEALKFAKGKYITFLDTDDFWNSKKLKTQIDFLKKNNLKFCYSNLNLKFKNKKNLFIKKDKDHLRSTQSLLKNYDIGILTVMVEKKLFSYKRFNKQFEIIGDFDLFIRLSEITLIGYINKCLATYRIHNYNLSRRKKNIHIKELDFWIKKNKSRLKNMGLSIRSIKINLLKLRIQNLINF